MLNLITRRVPVTVIPVAFARDDFKPKFVKHFTNACDHIISGIEAYIHAVRSEEFPENEHCYSFSEKLNN